MKTYSVYKLIITIAFFSYFKLGINAQHYTNFKFKETASIAIQQRMETNTKAVFKELHDIHFNNKSNISLSLENVTENAKQRIQSLWRTSKFYCRKTEIELPILGMSEERGYQVRNIPVIFVEGATQDDKFQDIVLEFTPDGMINDMYIAIARHTIIPETITDVTDKRRRALILDFVENFRTAYNRMDIGYLENIFSNEALIIVGKMVEQIGDDLKPKVSYEVKSKVQYITDLKRVFAANTFINVKFDEIKVEQHEDKGFIYGVSMRQRYKSSIYADEGWLFLIIDFSDENKPQIWVRTWQPLGVNGRFTLVHFPL